MNLLQFGFELMRKYEAAIQKNSTVESADLRLAAYAIEAALNHRQPEVETMSSKDRSLVKGVVEALAELRACLADLDFKGGKKSNLRLNLAVLNASLSNYLEQQQYVSRSEISSIETLKISREILNRLRIKTGLTSE